jgi:hypothetical protein
MIEVHQNDQNDTISFSSGESEYNIYSALDKVIADVAEPCTNCNDDYYRKTKVDGQFKDCCTACQCDECNGSGFTQSELTVQEIFERVINILQRQNDQINYAKSETQRLQANIEMKDKEIKELLSD